MNGAAACVRQGVRRALLGVVLLLAACARNPVSGLPELVLVSQEEEPR